MGGPGGPSGGVPGGSRGGPRGVPGGFRGGLGGSPGGKKWVRGPKNGLRRPFLAVFSYLSGAFGKVVKIQAKA